MNVQMTNKEELLYSTVRLVIYKTDIYGENKYATGFFIIKSINGNPERFLVLNKHTLFFLDEYKNEIFCKSLKFCVCEIKNFVIDDTSHIDFIAEDFYDKVIFHNENNVDLCMIPLSAFKRTEIGKTAYLVAFPAESINLTKCSKNYLDAIEDVITIGYPDAFWDIRNNKPIIRKGITASHPGLDFDGKKEFYLDIAVHEGSSGSPVFIIEPIQNPKTGAIVLNGETHFIFAGIIDAHRPIEVVNSTETDKFKISMNLAKVIKVERVLELLDFYSLQNTPKY